MVFDLKEFGLHTLGLYWVDFQKNLCKGQDYRYQPVSLYQALKQHYIWLYRKLLTRLRNETSSGDDDDIREVLDSNQESEQEAALLWINSLRYSYQTIWSLCYVWGILQTNRSDDFKRCPNGLMPMFTVLKIYNRFAVKDSFLANKNSGGNCGSGSESP